MNKIFFTFCLLFFSLSPAFAETSKSIDGEGRFYAKDDDTLNFIKSQLLYSAFVDVVTKELTFLGLDTTLFLKNYDEKFDRYFAPSKAKLEAKYGIDSDPTNKNKRDFNKYLRLKRLRLKSKFGNLNKAVVSYSIKKMTRSAQFPNSRYINISAKVDRRLLKKIYFQMITSSDAKEIKTIYLTSDFDLTNLVWSDLGVEVEKDFTPIIKQHWKKWLSENLKTSYGEVVITNTSSEKELENFLKAPKEVHADLDSDEPHHSNEYSNSLWLQINIKLSKIKESLLIKERTFRLSGGFILVDLNTGKVVHSFDMPVVENKYSFGVGTSLSTNIATWVYRTASSEFSKFDEKIAAITTVSKTVDLTVAGAKSYLDFEKIGDILAIKGASQRFMSKLLSFEGSRGRLRLHYTGSKEDLLKTLVSINNTPIDKQRVLINTPGEKPFNFLLTEVSEVKKVSEDKKNEKLPNKE